MTNYYNDSGGNTTNYGTNETLLLKKDIDSVQVGQQTENPKPKRIIGIVIVILILLLQTTLSEFGQVVLFDFPKPFFVCMSSSAFLFLAIPIELVALKIDQSKKSNKEKQPLMARSIQETNDELESNNNDSMIETIKSEFSKSEFSYPKFFLVCFGMTFLLLVTNWLWMIGFSLTEVSTATAIYQSATVFVFIFSIIILKDKPTLLKVVYVFLFIGGVVGITVADQLSGDDSSKFPHAVIGDIIMVVSACLWALYEVLVNKFFGKASRTVLNFFIGMTTFNMLIIGIPTLAIINKIGFEPFDLPDNKQLTDLAIMASIAFALLYVMNIGLSICSPLFVRSGELMTIPGTLFWDIIFKHYKMPLTSIPGFVAIIVGFVLSLYVENKAMKEHDDQSSSQSTKNSSKVDPENQISSDDFVDILVSTSSSSSSYNSYTFTS
ncbi:hypothetical protein DFA_12086 [Cavenderia fasciculata]|uniref:EamA domain-containing protein n=1 Tax=Cavenderia fasciculata TaxID=261658 RepID=F4QFR9_CACFS|nr:uncharacterized protein DFA_12086 [Cavenderia fasciculata]EGG14316.1 hypothetical protein DFA_12086 [Cavenderia fasciculata]|eukprot:XP_004351025.1 hypothetical protein DFA_12086 [Cavenderia fasciculata]